MGSSVVSPDSDIDVQTLVSSFRDRKAKNYFKSPDISLQEEYNATIYWLRSKKIKKIFLIKKIKFGFGKGTERSILKQAGLL